MRLSVIAAPFLNLATSSKFIIVNNCKHGLNRQPLCAKKTLYSSLAAKNTMRPNNHQQELENASILYEKYNTANEHENKFSIYESLNTSKTNSESDDDPFKKPSSEKLIEVKQILENHISNFFNETRHPTQIYTKDIIFENFWNEQGNTSVGLVSYLVKVYLFRVKINMSFQKPQTQILSALHDVKDGTIKIRWRISGKRFFQKLQRELNIFSKLNNQGDEIEWIDGFSIFYLRSAKGLIYKHRVQRVMSQEDETLSAKNDKNFNLKTNLNVGAVGIFADKT